MDSLYMLNLSQNLLTTSLDQLSRIHTLGYLDLSFNLMAGGISSSICNVSFLQILNLSYNKLIGTIPQCLGNLSSLQVLDLHNNKLHGTLPSTLSKIKGLRTLNLNGNQFEGPLPKSLSNCIQLELLNLGNNQIEDTFPHWLQTLPHLKVLVLRANKLHGIVANLKIKQPFPSLIIFDISTNHFSGPLPIAYVRNFKAMKSKVDSSLQYINIDIGFEAQPFRANYVLVYDSVTETIKGISITLEKIPTNFVYIDLSKNNFDGGISNGIKQLHALKGLNLSYNRLVGSIPQSMGDLAELESLDLSSNMLTGEIPIEFTNLNYLAILNLSYNHLVGEIPQGKQFNTFANDSYEGNVGLCGPPLSKECNKVLDQFPSPSTTFQLEQKFGFGWKPVAIGYGCGMVFGVGLGCCVLLIGKPEWLVRMVGGNPNKRERKNRTR
ncbi:receptor-like protein Cf-9 homolog isoform X2 [Abrus precatorius]|nr:receptor-like protein Cf-9 homolog isoform X2 [Abrus precatorius]